MPRLDPDAVRFECRFALSQAPACLFADLRVKDYGKRQAALDALAGLVAARFEKLEVMRPEPTVDPLPEASKTWRRG